MIAEFIVLQTQLDAFQYDGLDPFVDDVRIIFTNAIYYNGDNSEIGIEAKKLLEYFDVCDLGRVVMRRLHACCCSSHLGNVFKSCCRQAVRASSNRSGNDMSDDRPIILRAFALFHTDPFKIGTCFHFMIFALLITRQQ